ncbi:MAG TPA: GC-type dockerin domain-anchored protein [Phycisphaerales bacterium]|nr:GC-type dockerin domain-anchored protein [Phycisphaerales bacterium]
MNTRLNACSLSAAVALCTIAGSAYSQVEVVYAIEAHAPGHPKSVVPGIEGGTFRNFPRPHRSPDGRRWVVVATMNGFTGTQDQALVTGVGLTGAAVAQESVTLDNSGETFAFFTNVSPRVLNDGRWISAVSGGDKVVEGNLAGTVTIVARGGTPIGAPPGVEFAANAFSSANLTAAGPSFLASIAIAPSGANEMGIVGAEAELSMPIDVPTGQAGETEYPIADVDANSFWTSDSGVRWLAQGRIANPDQAADKVLVVDGAVRIQEGSTLPGMAAPVSAITESFMEGNGDWYSRGSNADSTGWIVKNGAVVAQTGGAIAEGSSESWTTFLDVRGNGRGDFAIAGRTNAEPIRSDVLVVNGRFIVSRESDGVDLDNDGVNETELFLHVLQNRVMFADDGYVYFGSRLKPAADATADVTGSASSSSLLRVAACPADLGRTGGVAGADATLDNNDFIAFIDFFFARDRRADRGGTGGVPGADGAWDNNDFVVYIDEFFGGCGA